MDKIEESETIELKKSVSEIKEAIIGISAILNKHQRGEIYFGIDRKGNILSQTITEKTLRDISQAISAHIEPRIYPKIEKVIIDSKELIKVTFKGQEAPYYAYNRAYMRVADENKQLSANEIENIILKKNKEKVRWDNQICEKAKLDDIDSEKLEFFLKSSNLSYDSIKNSLEKLNLLKDGKLLNSSVILFGKNPELFFPNAKLRCAVFGAKDTSYIIDMKDFEGDLFYLIEKAEEYLLKNIHIGMKVEGLKRIDVPEIDKEALREAIVNAFCHRDYYEYDSVNIAIFKNRVEIRNPGKLYGGLTIEQIKKGGISKRRNELIAEIFNKIHLIEKWGRGIRLILSKEPETDFKDAAGIFITTFKRKEEPESLPEKTTRGLVERLVEELVESQRRILELIKENPRITKSELAKKIGISTTAIDKNIEKLKSKKLLKRVGPDKGGYWKIISNKKRRKQEKTEKNAKKEREGAR